MPTLSSGDYTPKPNYLEAVGPLNERMREAVFQQKQARLPVLVRAHKDYLDRRHPNRR